MAITRTGDVGYSDQNTDNTGSFSVTVPADAEIMVVAAFGYDSDETGKFSSGSVTLGGAAMTSVGSHGDSSTSAFMGAVWYRVCTDKTGSQTVAWDWASTGALSNSAAFAYAFYKGINTSAPVSDDDGTQDADGGTVAIPTLTATSGTKAVAVGWSWSNYFNSWTNATQQASRFYETSPVTWSWAEADPSGNIDISCSLGADGGAIGLILAPAAAGGGRTTKNTRSFPLGIASGMNRRM